MTGFVAHRTVVLSFAVEAPVAYEAGSGRVNVADTVFDFVECAGNVPDATFRDVAVEEAGHTCRAADCEAIRLPVVTVVGDSEVHGAAILGFNEVNLFAVEIEAQVLAVVNGSEVQPVAGFEFFFNP